MRPILHLTGGEPLLHPAVVDLVGFAKRNGLNVSINSDDPAYFGGYVGDNYASTQIALGLSQDEMVTIARNSLAATFLPEDGQRGLLAELEEYVARQPAT